MLEIPIVNLESGNRNRRRRRRRRRQLSRPQSVAGGSESDNQSRHSPLNSASHDECALSGIEGVSDSDSSFSDSAWEVDLESGDQGVKKKGDLGKKAKRECRICKLRLEGGRGECGVAIELGCSCKGDLGAAHKKCAQTWFQTRGNTTCEICGATAVNVVCENAINESNSATAAASMATPADPPTLAEAPSFWGGRRTMNILLACMVLAFIISWLFHFHVFS